MRPILQRKVFSGSDINLVKLIGVHGIESCTYDTVAGEHSRKRNGCASRPLLVCN